MTLWYYNKIGKIEKTIAVNEDVKDEKDPREKNW